MTNAELQKKWDKAKRHAEIESAGFGRVLADRRNMDEEEFDSYCEEMQYALLDEEKYWKMAEGRLY